MSEMPDVLNFRAITCRFDSHGKALSPGNETHVASPAPLPRRL